VIDLAQNTSQRFYVKSSNVNVVSAAMNQQAKESDLHSAPDASRTNLETENRAQARNQPGKITPTELAQKICRLLRVEGTTPIKLSLLRNGGVLVSRADESSSEDSHERDVERYDHAPTNRRIQAR
jgi:hypothetical protein